MKIATAPTTLLSESLPDLRPAPASLPRSPSSPLRHAPARHFLEQLALRLQEGSLTVHLPGGDRIDAHGQRPGPHAELTVLNWRALWTLKHQGELGFSRAYRRGDWRSPDIVSLLRLSLAHEQTWAHLLRGALHTRLLSRGQYLLRHFNAHAQRKTVASHFNLGNHFYAQWLDRKMLYSSAMYRTGQESLDDAQEDQQQQVMALLDVPRQGRVLDIGCGWGSLAMRLAQERQARVHAITLAQEQFNLARQRINAAGLAPLIDLQLKDFQKVCDPYDRIVAIEALETLSEAQWPDFFSTLRRCLRPQGRVLLQAITIDENSFLHHRVNTNFVNHGVFQGGLLPTQTHLHRLAQNAGLRLCRVQHFGPSYAQTLAAWRQRFLAAAPQLSVMGFNQEFQRRWEYYLCYCEAGFHAQRLNVGLYVFEPETPARD